MTDDRIIAMLLDRFDNTDQKIDKLDGKIDNVEARLSEKIDVLKDFNNADHVRLRDKLNTEARKHDIEIVGLQGETKRNAAKVGTIVAAIVSVITSVVGYLIKSFFP